jgi:hypothetical protein
MADVAEAEPSPGLPGPGEAPVLGRAASHLSTSDQQTPAGGSPKVNQRSFSFPRGGSPKAGEEGAARASAGSGFSQWARGFRLPSSLGASSGPSAGGESPKASPFSMLTSGFGKRVAAKAPAGDAAAESTSGGAGGESAESGSAMAGAVQEGNAFDTFTKGFMDSSRNAVRSVQLKARHLVSQNKRRYQVRGSSFGWQGGLPCTRWVIVCGARRIWWDDRCGGERRHLVRRVVLPETPWSVPGLVGSSTAGPCSEPPSCVDAEHGIGGIAVWHVHRRGVL